MVAEVENNDYLFLPYHSVRFNLLVVVVCIADTAVVVRVPIVNEIHRGTRIAAIRAIKLRAASTPQNTH